jgi:acetyl-CoA carboxylase biotin carboxyl carrier protein
MRKPNPFDADAVRELAKLLAETDLTEIEVQKGDLRIRVARNVTMTVSAGPGAAAVPTALAVAATAPAAAATDSARKDNTITSPMVGTAFRRPSPEAKPFVELGATVKEGERILLIEAMKTFNEITAPRSGTVSEILVEDGQPVEFGEPLMVIE